MKQWLALVCFVNVVLFAPLAWSYVEEPVKDGGHITGHVSLMGNKPIPKAFNIVTFPDSEYCGRISTGTGWRLLDEFHVAPTGGLQGVVVMLEGIEKGKPFHVPVPTIEAKDCMYSPNVLVVRDLQPIQVVNMDPIVHDVQIYEMAPFGAEIMFHRPLRMNPYHQVKAQSHEHRPGEPLVDMIHFSKGRRIFFLECGFHGYMQSQGVAVTNPYFAITDEQGNFTISDIPEGVYTLVAWHPGMGGILDMQVVVLANETITTRFEYQASDVRQSPHTTMVENPHFGPEVLGMLGKIVNIVPTHEVQVP